MITAKARVKMQAFAVLSFKNCSSLKSERDKLIGSYMLLF